MTVWHILRRESFQRARRRPSHRAWPRDGLRTCDSSAAHARSAMNTTPCSRPARTARHGVCIDSGVQESWERVTKLWVHPPERETCRHSGSTRRSPYGAKRWTRIPP
jgi:hypothetical protein